MIARFLFSPSGVQLAPKFCNAPTDGMSASREVSSLCAGVERPLQEVIFEHGWSALETDVGFQSQSYWLARVKDVARLALVNRSMGHDLCCPLIPGFLGAAWVSVQPGVEKHNRNGKVDFQFFGQVVAGHGSIPLPIRCTGLLSLMSNGCVGLEGRPCGCMC